MKMIIVWLGAGFLLADLQATNLHTVGGSGGRFITVTTLAESGRGSLREALEQGEAREIRFAVGGEIWLGDALRITNPYVTVAGESAPDPGITIFGDGIHVNTHDVILRHLRIRVGALLSGTEPRNRDGIAINGGGRILVENCSVTWAQDENIQIWGNGCDDVIIRRCLIAEGLRLSLHPKGEHSAGLIVGPGTRNYLLHENLFVSNGFRNPVVTSDTSGLIVNNLIYNPGFGGIHFYGRDGPLADSRLVAGVLSNCIIAGPDTWAQLKIFQRLGLNSGSRIYLSDNVAIGTQTLEKVCPPGWSPKDPSPFPDMNPLTLARGIIVLSASQVQNAVLQNVGARPEARDEVDRRLIEQVRQRKGSVIDVPGDNRLIGGKADFKSEEMSEFARLLQTYSTPKGVAFRSWRSHAADKKTLDLIISQFEEKGCRDLADSINAHNALVLHGVLNLSEADFETSMENYTHSLHPIVVRGSSLTLGLFAEQIKSRYPDERVGFALYAATAGGPQLANFPYVEDFIRTQLDRAVADFVNSSRGVRVKDGRLLFPAIFRQERARFSQGERAFVNRYLNVSPGTNAHEFFEPDTRLDEAW